MSSQNFLGETPGVPVGQDFDYRHPVESFLPTAQAVALQPVVFFSALARRGNYLGPLIFAVICAEVSAILGGILGLLAGNTVGGFVSSLIVEGIGAVISLFIVAGIAHLLVMLIVKSPNNGFEATFRVASYASVTSLASWIPLIGPFISLYGLYLAIVGIREMHQTTSGKAAMVVLIPVLAVLVIAVMATVAFGLAMLSGLR